MATRLTIGICAFVLLMLLAYTVALAVITPVQITSDPLIQGRGDVNGDYIVWKGNQSGNYDIYMRDITTGINSTVYADAYNQNMASTNGQVVVWEDYSAGKADIWMKDIAAGTPAEPLVTGAGNQGVPVIDGTTVIYVDDHDGVGLAATDIYTIDIVTRAVQPVVEAANAQWQPRISGTRVVWEDSRSGDYDVYMKDLSGGGEVAVHVGAGDQKVVDIDREKVVWQHCSGAQCDIVMKDLDTGIEEAITNDAAFQNSPRIFGDLVVWEDCRNGLSPNVKHCGADYNYDVYYKDLTSGTETQISTNSSVDWQAAVDGETVVWDAYGATSYDMWMATIPDLTPPEIDSLSPPHDSAAGCTAPLISASYSDNRMGIDTGSVQLLLDSVDVTAGATVTETGVSYQPASPLNYGTHTVELSVDDNVGNSASTSWQFTTSHASLSLSYDGSDWDSMGHYLAGILTVRYGFTNSDPDTAALNLELTSSPASNGVTLAGTPPLLLGNVAPASTLIASVQYNVPPEVGSFMADVYASWEDPCGMPFSAGPS